MSEQAQPLEIELYRDESGHLRRTQNDAIFLAQSIGIDPEGDELRIEFGPGRSSQHPIASIQLASGNPITHGEQLFLCHVLYQEIENHLLDLYI